MQLVGAMQSNAPTNLEVFPMSPSQKYIYLFLMNSESAYQYTIYTYPQSVAVPDAAIILFLESGQCHSWTVIEAADPVKHYELWSKTS